MLVSIMNQAERSKERTEKAARLTGRMLNANIISGYCARPTKPRNTETWDNFRDVSSDETLVAGHILDHHLRKDKIKT